jgi:hypothetical protein
VSPREIDEHEHIESACGVAAEHSECTSSLCPSIQLAAGEHGTNGATPEHRQAPGSAAARAGAVVGAR